MPDLTAISASISAMERRQHTEHQPENDAIEMAAIAQIEIGNSRPSCND
jgi:hypothetical protein